MRQNQTGQVKRWLKMVRREGRPRCAYCGRCLDESNATIDHVVPRCYGGQNEPENKVLCCDTCNGEKEHEMSVGAWVPQYLRDSRPTRFI